MFKHAPAALALLALSAQAFAAGNTLFDDFAPLTAVSSPLPVGSALEASQALLLPAGMSQRSIVSRSALGALNDPRVGRYWDMIDTNRSGPDAGRYLFMPFEPSNGDVGCAANCASGVLRVDLRSGTAATIVPVGTLNFQRGDASRWTPWGSYLTAEENWTPGNLATGRLFEVTNPVTATATTLTNGTGNLVQRNNVLPHTSHEGLVFDSQRSLYYIDEFAGGSIYKFVSASPMASNGDDYFAAGTNYVLKVGAGNNSSAAGAFSWVAMAGGAGLDARAQADTLAGTAYNRPEDMEITTLANGHEAIMFTATGTHDVWTVDLAGQTVKRFVSRDTLNLATGLAVGSALASPDNLAIDADGNLYVIEDQGPPNADIWMAIDADRDGVAEGVKRWAAMQVAGAEPTGLFFDPFNPNKAYLNIQHPDSLNDRLVEISAVPEPGTYALMIGGLALLGGIARRRHGG